MGAFGGVSPIWRFAQDHVKKNLCFLGTEFGLFFTLDGGEHWIKLTGNVPTIPFRDIEIQKRENDLVGATFGRGFFVLDDYSPLRHVSNELLTASEFTLFPVKKSLLYVPRRVLGGEKGSQGDSFFTASNPPYGAIFTYYLCESFKTRRQTRQEAEEKKKKTGGDNVYPGWDALKKEEREESPVIIFEITDSDGKVINSVTGPATAGFHRVTWNLRYAGVTSGSNLGPLVLPGKYTVRVTKRVDDTVTTLGKPRTFKVVSPPPASPPWAARSCLKTIPARRHAVSTASRATPFYGAAVFGPSAICRSGATSHRSSFSAPLPSFPLPAWHISTGAGRPRWARPGARWRSPPAFSPLRPSCRDA